MVEHDMPNNLVSITSTRIETSTTKIEHIFVCNGTKQFCKTNVDDNGFFINWWLAKKKPHPWLWRNISVGSVAHRY